MQPHHCMTSFKTLAKLASSFHVFLFYYQFATITMVKGHEYCFLRIMMAFSALVDRHGKYNCVWVKMESFHILTIQNNLALMKNLGY